MPVEPGNRSRFDVRRVDETGSTNADVLDLARAGAPAGVVVVADHQRAGRGRLGRTWQAPPGSSLLLTVLLRPPATDAQLLTTVVALAMADAVAATTGVTVGLKWPNDLVLDDRKLAGVLAEADWSDADRPAVAVGVGVNCNWPDDVPAELVETMTSLDRHAGSPVDRDALLDAFLDELAVRTGGGQLDHGAVLDEWRQRSATLGRRVRVVLADGEVEGTAVDVDTDGRLVVETDDGSSKAYAAGDVIHLRPAPGTS